jgi:hypothetical protein
MRGERAEEVEPNGNGHQEVCEFCTWVCGNSTHLITNAMTTTTAAAARILKQPPSPFFTKTLVNCQPLLACNSQLGACSSCNRTCSATVVVFLNSAARILLRDFCLNPAGYEFSFFLLQLIPTLFVETHGDKF